MIAYKAFNKDLTCTSGGNTFQYHECRVNECEAANCKENGFHCAENPLDCLSYYSDMKKAVYYKVHASGDIDEDGNDSKISCTELMLIEKLELSSFVTEALKYIKKHPFRDLNGHICYDYGKVDNNNFVIVRGFNPVAVGKQVGDVLGFVVDEPHGGVLQTTQYTIDGVNYLTNVAYGANGTEVARRE